MKIFTSTVFLFIFSLITISSFAQQTIYVHATATGNNNGTTWTDAYPDLQDALANYDTNDQIWVANGMYIPQNEVTLPSAGNSKKTFHIDKDVQIYGGFAGTETSITERDIANNPTLLSGDINGDDVDDNFEMNRTDNAINVVYVEGVVTTAAVFDGFTIEGGHAAGDTLILTDLRGGGIFSWGAIQVSNCTFQQNYAQSFGGGLYYRDAAADGAKVMHSTFEKNATGISGGGMIAAILGGSIEIDNCIFNENTAGADGAGLYASSASTTTTNCTFTNNTSGSWGAFYIWANEDDPNSYLVNSTIENCNFDNNSGQFGGGFGSWVTSFDMKDCTFTNNQTVTNNTSYNTLGGAIFFEFQSTTDKRKVNIQNCDFNSNSSEGESGAIGIFDNCATQESNEITIDNCLFKENNSANTGAIGIGLLSNEATISNSIFDANVGGTVQAIGGGGLTFTAQHNLRITNCLFTNHIANTILQPIIGFAAFDAVLTNNTFTNNEASGIGSQSSSDIKLQNNIINTAPGFLTVGSSGFGTSLDEIFTSLGGNLFSDLAANTFALSVDLQGVDPLFEAGTSQLSATSPCVDAGILPNDIPEFDLAGNARLQGGCLDMGAYESVHDAGVACVTSTRETLVDATAITIFPNPASGHAAIVLENNWQGALQIRFVNILGQTSAVHTIEKMNPELQFDLNTSSLVPGQYQVLISNGVQLATSSFVKF